MSASVPVPDGYRAHPCGECEHRALTRRLLDSHVSHEHRPYIPDDEVDGAITQARAQLLDVQREGQTPAQVAGVLANLQLLVRMLADDIGAPQ